MPGVWCASDVLLASPNLSCILDAASLASGKDAIVLKVDCRNDVAVLK